MSRESVERELLDEEHFNHWYETLLKEMAGKTDTRRIRSKSIAFKLTIAFVVSLVLQSVLVSSHVVAGELWNEEPTNTACCRKGKGRRNNLENQMKNVWTNFSHHTDT